MFGILLLSTLLPEFGVSFNIWLHHIDLAYHYHNAPFNFPTPFFPFFWTIQFNEIDLLVTP